MVLFKSLQRKSFSEKLVYTIAAIICGAVALSYLYIAIWLFIAGCRTHVEIATDPFGLPAHWNFGTYIDAFTLFEVNGIGFWEMFFNSLWWSIIPTALNIFLTGAFAYTCSKYTFPTSKWPYFIIMTIITLPIYGAGGAAYKLNWALGFINNRWSAFFGISCFTMHYLYFQAFYRNLSWVYAEAAQIDGANDYQIFFRVMLPQTMPLMTALFVTGWMSAWDAYEGIMINQPKLPTLPVGIYQFNVEMTYRARLDIMFAACFLISIPCIIVFLCFNKVITTNVSLGGIKG